MVLSNLVPYSPDAPIVVSLVAGGGAQSAPSVSQRAIAQPGAVLVGGAVAPTGEAAVVMGGGETYVAGVKTHGGLQVSATTPLPDLVGARTSIVFDGVAFLAFGQACCSGPGALVMQRIGLDGLPVGGAMQLASALAAYATGSTPHGAGVVWTAGPRTAPLHVSLVSDDGHILRDVTRPNVLDDGPAASLTWVGDRLVYVEVDVTSGGAGVATTVLDLGWFGEPSAEFSVPAQVDAPPVLVSGDLYVQGVDASGARSVYQLAPGGNVKTITSNVPDGSVLGADGCGHLLVASAPARKTGVPYETGGPWTVRAFGQDGSLSVGSDLAYVYMVPGTFLTASPSTTFVWAEQSQGAVSPSTVRLATVGWH